MFAYLRLGHKEARRGCLCESVDWTLSIANDAIWRENGENMHNGKRCLMLEAGTKQRMIDILGIAQYVVVGTTQRVDSKTPMCSIVVYGNTLLKRSGKGTDDDNLLDGNVFCVHPDDFTLQEDGQMVEVFVTSPIV